MTSDDVLELLDTRERYRSRDPHRPRRRHGMRLGEVLGLWWTDVDLEKRFARISQTVQETPQGVMSVAPKTHCSRRSTRPQFQRIHRLSGPPTLRRTVGRRLPSCVDKWIDSVHSLRTDVETRWHP